MTRKLEGKVAVVTGASKGIGAAIARALADEGAAVVVNYSSSKSGADHVVADIAARGGSAIAVQGDVSKRAHVERLFAEATKAFGRLDILVNNAGVYEFGPLGDVTEELFHKHFDLNVLGLLLTTKEAVRHMGPEGGSIINIGSGASSMRPPNSAVYTGSKAAVDAITGVLAKELGPRKIRVNSINPGMIETEGGAHRASWAATSRRWSRRSRRWAVWGSPTISRRRPSTWRRPTRSSATFAVAQERSDHLR